MNPEAILDFWFGELKDGFSDEAHRARWFAADAAFDRSVRDQFAGALQEALDGKLSDWLAAAMGRLAFIVLTDQFSRQIYRGSDQAFAADSLALSAARDGIERGMDRKLAFDQRAFFYMPFEHSEVLVDQHTAVGLFSQLRDDTPSPYRHHTGTGLRHAHQHRDIIQRFGRFPHRNAVLGRVSESEELEFLAQAGASFGQSTDA